MSVISQVKELFPATCWPDVWLVGGTVRDLLLDQQVQDIDLVTAIPPAHLEELGFRPVSPVSTTPIWFRHIPGMGKIEIICIAKRSHLQEDLTRRDFTMNALAISLDGEVVDVCGGQRDLSARQLRICSVRSLPDDPIRIFRAFRFATDAWYLHPDTVQQISSRQWDQSCSNIPVERFTMELQKSLAKPHPERFFTLMLKHSIGEVYLPELFRMPQVPAGPLQYHPEGDLFTHSLQVMQRVATKTSDPMARFCGFFHDLGKLSTDPALYPKHHGHDEAGFTPVHSMCERLRLPSNWQKALAFTCRLHTKANNWDALRTSTRIRLTLQAAKAGIAEILPLVSSADKPDGSGMTGWKTALRVIAMTTAELGIDQQSFTQMPVHHRANHILHKRIHRLSELMS